jgi:outer membrane protein
MRPAPSLSLLVTLVSLLALAAPSTARGAQDPVQGASPRRDAIPEVASLSLAEAVERALAASPRLGRFTALQSAAAAERQGAEAGRWPELELSAGYQRRSEVKELSIVSPTQDPTQPIQLITIFPNIQDNWRLRAGAVWPLYTGGRVGGRIDASRQGLAAAEHDLRAARSDLVLETKSAYWSLVTARESERVLRDAIRAFESHLADARNRESVGLAARNEVLAVQVERDRAELERLRAEAAALVSAANLRRLLDLPPAAGVETSEPLAAAEAAVPEVEALVGEAQARPDRAALAARVSAAEAFGRTERAARLPQVVASAGYTYSNPNRDIVPPEARWQDTWDVGVGVAWNVLDGGRRSAGEARARAQADAVREQLRELDRAIRLEVTQRALELGTAKARLNVAERGLEAAVENQRVAADRYREGVIPSSELLDAELALERAALARTESQAALRLASAALDRAVGR